MKSARNYKAIVVAKNQERVIYNSWFINDECDKRILHTNGCRTPEAFHGEFK